MTRLRSIVRSSVTRLVVFYNRLIPEHQNAASKTPEKIQFQIADFREVFGTHTDGPATRVNPSQGRSGRRCEA